MSYNPNRSNNYITLKLTDTGRRLATLGQLTFENAVVSDREVNYGVLRNAGTNFERYLTIGDRFNETEFFQSNRILAPASDQLAGPLQNYDMSNPYPLTTAEVQNLTTTTTAMTDNIGMFFPLNTGSTSGDTIVSADYVFNDQRYITSGYVNQSVATTNSIAQAFLDAQTKIGDIAIVRWSPPSTGGFASYDEVRERASTPLVTLGYRIQSILGTVTQMDRNIPTFFGAAVIAPYYTYPHLSAETYYGSGTTAVTRMWNLNIVRTSTEIGGGSNVNLAYTNYGSLDFNGSKQYLGFENNYRAVGIIHYSNRFRGQTYGDGFVAGAVQIDLPTVLWHNYDAIAGKAQYGGVRLTDKKQPTEFDSVARTQYRNLVDERGYVVGRVYPTLKIFAITDPELLNAMSHKSNRNWTLPKPTVTLTDIPKAPLTTTNASPALSGGESMLITYMFEADPKSNNAAVSLGMGAESMHCGYIQKVDCVGDPKYVSVTFPDGGFPYLRNEAGFTTYSGTGWSADRCKILAYKFNTSAYTNINSVDNTNWIKLGGAAGVATGNGAYSGETGQNTIDPAYMQAHKFVISAQDYTSGVTYNLGNFIIDNSENNSPANLPLNLGDESFLLGNVQAGIYEKVHKTIINLTLDEDALNGSFDENFSDVYRDEAYITEVGILNRNNELVAVGKPTYPIRKTDFRLVVFQLEFDF